MNWMMNKKMNKEMRYHFAFLSGPPGSGKTTAVHMLSAECGLQLVEIDVNENRMGSKLMRYVISVASRLPLSSKHLPKCLLIEGLDNLYDAGNALHTLKILKPHHAPVIFTANDLDINSVRSIATASLHIRFYSLNKLECDAYLKHILVTQNKAISETSWKNVVHVCNGDMRQMNMLISNPELSSRECFGNIFDKMRMMFDGVYVDSEEDDLLYSGIFENYLNITNTLYDAAECSKLLCYADITTDSEPLHVWWYGKVCKPVRVDFPQIRKMRYKYTGKFKQTLSLVFNTDNLGR